MSKTLSLRISDSLAEQLGEHCDTTGEAQTSAVINAIQLYIGSPYADPLQTMITQQNAILELLEALPFSAPEKVPATRAAAAPDERTVSEDSTHQPDVIWQLLVEWKAETDRRGQSPKWADWARALNDAGHTNKKGGIWIGDTIRAWHRKRALREI